MNCFWAAVSSEFIDVDCTLPRRSFCSGAGIIGIVEWTVGVALCGHPFSWRRMRTERVATEGHPYDHSENICATAVRLPKTDLPVVFRETQVNCKEWYKQFGLK
jgi:hypothetical protein